MLIFKIKNDSDWIEVQNDIKKVVEPILKEKTNGCGSLNYKIAKDDSQYDNYERFKTRILVQEDEIILFSGRLLETSKDFYNVKSLTFEGDLAMLNDVQYPPYEFSGTISDFFVAVLNYYNSRCSNGNEILKGRITVTDANNYIARSDINYSSCWDALNKKLVELCGGYLKLRCVLVDGTVYRYLDYLENPGTLSSQTIEFGSNILDINQNLTGEDVVTVLIPFGAEDEDTGERINIESVNPTGKNYIVSSNYEKFGKIEKVEYWDDVTLPINLYHKALTYLSEHDSSGNTIKISAVDLHMINIDVSEFHVGDSVKVISKPHNIDTYMLINERTRNLNDVSKDSITLGNEEKTFTSLKDSSSLNSNDDIDVEEIKKEIISVIEEEIPTEKDIEDISTIQTKLLLGDSKGYFKVLYGTDSDEPAGFMLMDSNDEATAINVWKFTKSGFGFSNSGVNGPYYNAWTIDGHLVADHIYSGTLASRDGSFKLDLDTGELTVTGIQSQIDETNQKVNDVEDNLNDLNTETNNIKSDYLSKNDEDYKKITTAVSIGNEGVTISGSTNGSDNPTKLRINSYGVYILDKSGNTITSMTSNEFRTGKWVLQQTNDNKTFNIFREQ